MGLLLVDRWHTVFCIVLILLISGCANLNTGMLRTSSVEPFIPSNAASYTIESNQRFIIGKPLNPLQPPIYPSTAKTTSDEVSVCLEISISEDGVVYESRPLTAIPGCPNEAGDIPSEFASSARQAAMTWRFTPSRLCTYAKGYDATTETTGCGGPVMQIVPVPIRLAFRFRFTRGASRVGEVTMRRLGD